MIVTLGSLAPELVAGNAITVERLPSSVIPLLSSPQSPFSRLVALTPQTLVSRIDDELAALMEYRMDCLNVDSLTGDVECLPFIAEASSLLLERRRNLLSLLTQEMKEKEREECIPMSGAVEEVSFTLSDEKDEKEENAVLLNDTLPEFTSSFFFFQSSLGSLAFIHPLCYKCLFLQASQDPLQLPASLTCKVVEVEKLRVTKAVKKTHPFLRHLPENCDIHLIEVDLKDLVDKSILSQFKSEFQRRAKARKEKEKEFIYTLLSEEDSRY